MQLSILKILTLIGSLGFFMFGMKIMSEAIQKIAGGKIRNAIESLSSNRTRGILSGFGITSLIQSSSATTVLVVGFVNAGLLTVVESIGIILGANIGTTVTAWLISILGFEINIEALTLPMIGIGFPLIFSKKSNIKSWGEFLIGFSLLFMGLNELKNTVPDLSQYPEVFSFLSNYTGFGLISILLFLALGLLLTMLVQSSSAAMAMTLVLASEGWLPFDLAASMVLGANIGTTITANLAAIIGNVFAKRAAISHLIINVVGSIWMISLLPIFLRGINQFMVTSYGLSPFDPAQPESMPIALSIFHSSFNIVNALILVWFIPGIARMAESIIPSGGSETFQLKHIGAQIVPISEIQIVEAKKEILVSVQVLSKMAKLLEEMILNPKSKTWHQSLAEIKRYEEITDRVELEVANFLTRSTEGNISARASTQILTILRINSDLENIGDLYFKMSLLIQRIKESSEPLAKMQTTQLIEILDLTNQARKIMEKNLLSENGQFDYNKAVQKEREIDAKRNEMRRGHLRNIGEKEQSVQIGMYYSDLFSCCEEIGDYLMSVSQAINDERASLG